MDFELLQKLKEWRRDAAQKEGMNLFRVLSNAAIENVATLKPKTKEELVSINGIKEKKFEKYGASILALVNEDSEVNGSNGPESKGKTNEPYTISGYLNFLNKEFKKYKARVRGEISGLDIRDSYLFFSLKDKEDESVLSCFMWKSNSELCGTTPEVGLEVIVDGVPEIYTPSGRFNFKVSTVELVGEGALKKAYDRLKQRLEKEGLFSVERKKPIPELPQRIGLITSESGAVIHDFLNNLGKYGFHISFVNSRVEGQAAVHGLLSAIEYFNGKDIDVLVIIRGGGSLESLQAFNNEALVRKIADSKTPVICGIGHEKDTPLASLAADKAVSTATAAAVALNQSWEKVASDIAAIEKDMVYQYQKALDVAARRIELVSGRFIRFFDSIFQTFEGLRHAIKNNLSKIAYELKDTGKTLLLLSKSLLDNLKGGLENRGEMLKGIEKQLRDVDPARQLRLGYSIVSVSGRVIKTVRQVKVGTGLDIKVSDGNIKSIVSDINQ